MAVKFVIVFLINSVITNDVVLSNGVDVPNLIPSANPLVPHEDDTLFNNQVTENQNNYDDVIELQKEDPTRCHSTEVLLPILNQILNLLTQDPSNINKLSKSSALLQEYLKNMPDGHNENYKLTNAETGVPKDTLRTAYYDGRKGHIKTKIVFKYDLPSINQPHCKDVFMKLIKSAYDAYVQLAKNPMCQNANILEALLKPYEAPYNNLNSNSNPNLASKKDEYSIYDLLKPLHPEKDNYEFYQNTKNSNDLTNVYSPNKPVQLNGDSQTIKDTLGSKPNILDSDNRIPNIYDFNAYDYGKNPSTITHDINHYLPESHSKDYSNYEGDINFNIYGNNKNNQIPQKKNSNSLLLDLNKLISNTDTSKVLENNSKLPLHILMDSINGINQNPVDSIISKLSTDKTSDEMQDKLAKLINPQNYPNINLNGVQNGQNVKYPYLSNQDNNLVYQYATPVDPTNQISIPNFDVSLPNQYLTQYNPINKYIPNQYGIPNKIYTAKSYLQNVYNNYMHKLSVVPNKQQIDGVPNAFKLDPSVNAGVIELTYVVKRATPLIYKPQYFVKFSIPYSTFLKYINNLILTKPYLKINPLKLYQELIALSHVSDISPALKGYKKEDILKLAYKDGELVTAKLVKDDNALNNQLKLMQSLNSGVGAADIAKLSNKYGFLRTSIDKGNSSDSVGIGRYGSIMMPYYDLSSPGIGFSSGLINSYESRQASPSNTISSSFFGTNAIRPNQLYSGTSQNPTLGKF